MPKLRSTPRPPRPALTRQTLVGRLQRQLERDAWPRLQMSLLVGLTGGFGLLSSFTLLHAGLDSMVVRYPLALGCAYLFFLGLLWLWLRTRLEDYIDLPDPGGADATSWVDSGVRMASRSGEVFAGQGGEFSGAGASSGFDAPATADTGILDGVPLSDKLDVVGDADELAVPLILLALAVGLALALLYIVYGAPVLFAELMVDGALSVGLYRHLRHTERRHWLSSALRRTVLPFVLTGCLLTAGGWALTQFAPGARTLGEAWRLAHDAETRP